MMDRRAEKTFDIEKREGWGHAWMTVGQPGGMITERCTRCGLEIQPGIKGQRERGDSIPCLPQEAACDGGEQREQRTDGEERFISYVFNPETGMYEYPSLTAEFRGSCGQVHRIRVAVLARQRVKGDEQGRRTIFEYYVAGVEAEEVPIGEELDVIRRSEQGAD